MGQHRTETLRLGLFCLLQNGLNPRWVEEVTAERLHVLPKLDESLLCHCLEIAQVWEGPQELLQRHVVIPRQLSPVAFRILHAQTHILLRRLTTSMPPMLTNEIYVVLDVLGRPAYISNLQQTKIG